MDCVGIEKTKENFRVLYDTKGRFVLHKISQEEASYKLCKVKKIARGPKGIPYAMTHDGRTIRYPDPDVKVNDSVKLDIATGKMTSFLKFELGATTMIIRGHNAGRVGQLLHVERHDGSFSIITVKDSRGVTFATRLANAFIIGAADQTLVTLPKGKGIKKTILEERDEAVKRGEL